MITIFLKSEKNSVMWCELITLTMCWRAVQYHFEHDVVQAVIHAVVRDVFDWLVYSIDFRM